MKRYHQQIETSMAGGSDCNQSLQPIAVRRTNINSLSLERTLHLVGRWLKYSGFHLNLVLISVKKNVVLLTFCEGWSLWLFYCFRLYYLFCSFFSWVGKHLYRDTMVFIMHSSWRVFIRIFTVSFRFVF